MINIYSTYQNVIATITGIIVQVLFTKNIHLTLVLTIIFTGIMVNLYIIYPLVGYMKIEGTRWEATAYALGAAISLILIRLILNLLPALIKAKVIRLLGLDIEVINNELERTAHETKDNTEG